ncbi:MAG: hypothetical protein V4550_19985 [Gemmatimonadota bacterium]
MTMSRSTLTGFLVSGLVLLGACGDDPTAPIEGGGDPENIARVTVTLTPVGGGTAVTSVRVDPDGTSLPKPVNVAVGTLALTKGKTYNGTIELLNDLDPKDIVDISDEVQKEANFHRFFYTLTCSGVNVPVSSLDLDTQVPGQPLGLKFQVVVDGTAASSTNCSLHVELHHFESAKGNGLGSTFDTDLSLDFPVTIS